MRISRFPAYLVKHKVESKNRMPHTASANARPDLTSGWALSLRVFVLGCICLFGDIMKRDKLLTISVVIAAFAIAAFFMAIPKLIDSIYDTIPMWLLQSIAIGSEGLLVLVILFMLGLIYWPSKAEEALRMIGIGGCGGNAKVAGKNSVATGGRGGEGGSTEVNGDNALAVSGDGGNAGQQDGRGGRRAISHTRRMWNFSESQYSRCERNWLIAFLLFVV